MKFKMFCNPGAKVLGNFVPKHLIGYDTVQFSDKYSYRVRINYQRILQNHIFTNTEQKYMTLLPLERGMFAVS